MVGWVSMSGHHRLFTRDRHEWWNAYRLAKRANHAGAHRGASTWRNVAPVVGYSDAAALACHQAVASHDRWRHLAGSTTCLSTDVCATTNLPHGPAPPSRGQQAPTWR